MQTWTDAASPNIEHDSVIIDTVDERIIARVVNGWNAPLIAAAPDLLEACKEVMRSMEYAPNQYQREVLIPMLAAAIAKATGQ